MILLHTDPKTSAQRLAQHLEVNYGLQLDVARHKSLVEEIESFFPSIVVEKESAAEEAAPPAEKVRKPRAKTKEK